MDKVRWLKLSEFFCLALLVLRFKPVLFSGLLDVPGVGPVAGYLALLAEFRKGDVPSVIGEDNPERCGGTLRRLQLQDDWGLHWAKSVGTLYSKSH